VCSGVCSSTPEIPKSVLYVQYVESVAVILVMYLINDVLLRPPFGSSLLRPSLVVPSWSKQRDEIRQHGTERGHGTSCDDYRLVMRRRIKSRARTRRCATTRQHGSRLRARCHRYIWQNYPSLPGSCLNFSRQTWS